MVSPARPARLGGSIDVTQESTDSEKFTPITAILSRARASLDCIEQTDFDELKAMKKPSKEIERIMGCVMILFGNKIDWNTSQLVLNRPDCLTMFHRFSPEIVPVHTLDKIKKIVKENDNMKPEELITKSSAAASISEWVHAVIKYRDLLASV